MPGWLVLPTASVALTSSVYVPSRARWGCRGDPHGAQSATSASSRSRRQVADAPASAVKEKDGSVSRAGEDGASTAGASGAVVSSAYVEVAAAPVFPAPSVWRTANR